MCSTKKYGAAKAHHHRNVCKRVEQLVNETQKDLLAILQKSLDRVILSYTFMYVFLSPNLILFLVFLTR